MVAVEAGAVEGGEGAFKALEVAPVEESTVSALAVDSTVSVAVLTTEAISDSSISRSATESCKVIGTNQSATST